MAPLVLLVACAGPHAESFLTAGQKETLRRQDRLARLALEDAARTPVSTLRRILDADRAVFGQVRLRHAMLLTELGAAEARAGRLDAALAARKESLAQERLLGGWREHEAESLLAQAERRRAMPAPARHRWRRLDLALAAACEAFAQRRIPACLALVRGGLAESRRLLGRGDLAEGRWLHLLAVASMNDARTAEA
ncbi:MAG: hypothetical protein K2W96_23915, partial [Gemmataceae bacterium]|nr:hypothetical protein [Gemmataceae bacterium]